MEVEITLKRIKVKQPRILLYIDGPYLEDASESEKEVDRLVTQACDEFNQKLREIFKRESDPFMNAYFPDWMTRWDRSLFIENWESYKSHMTQLSAERYALYLDRQSSIPKETSTEPTERTGTA